MNILIVYATYSSGTLTASELIRDTLNESGHTAILKNVATVEPDEFNDHDLVILGSPSWMIDHKDGQPHHLYFDLFKKAAGKQFAGKNFAVFGLGDTTFAHFCGAVDHLEDFVEDIQGTLTTPSLRIDSYYFDQEKNEAELKLWLNQVIKNPPSS